VEFYDNGKLKDIVLGNDASFYWVGYKKGTRLSFAQCGRFVSAELGGDTVIQRIKFKAGTTVYFHAPSPIAPDLTANFESPAIASVWLIDDTVIDGKVYKAGWQISFDWTTREMRVAAP
jgi:hypothetical protein